MKTYGFGEFFGELALRSNQPRAATVRSKVRHHIVNRAQRLCGGTVCCRPHANTVMLSDAQGFSTTVLQLPRKAFEWLMHQKADLAQQIEAQAATYSGGSFGKQDTSSMSESQLRELCDAQVRYVWLGQP